MTMVMGSLRRPRSAASLRSHSASLVAAAAAWYSDSTEEAATVRCCWLHQLTAVPPKLRVVGSPAQSASQ